MASTMVSVKDDRGFIFVPNASSYASTYNPSSNSSLVSTSSISSSGDFDTRTLRKETLTMARTSKAIDKSLKKQTRCCD
jgi:hypothetical protein